MVASARFAVNVEAAVYRDGEYLLVERAPGEAHAAGELGLVGGTIESDEAGDDVLAATARREVREETGVEVGAVTCVTSSRFVADEGTPVVNVVMLARHESGRAEIREPGEVASVGWYAPGEVAGTDDVPAYTREYVAAAEERRRELGW